MVAVSDGVDRKTTNNLEGQSGVIDLFFPHGELFPTAFHLPLYGWEVGGLDHFQYLLLMACCLLITLPLEFVLGARVYRRAAGLAFAMIPVVIIFSIWDIVGILRDHWSLQPAVHHRLEVDLRHADRGIGVLRCGADLRAC